MTPWTSRTSGGAQEPLAIVGIACRLPDGNSSPSKLWDFLEEGNVASNAVPHSRFNLKGHWDGSHKPGTMRPPGGMFLSEHDMKLSDFDASFFELAGAEALATDPNQRQLLEVVYEGLESAGIPMRNINGSAVACFVASFAVDYADIHARDPENRPSNTALGVGRAILANRISWFFNLKGPSITIDTACSGSLVALDMAVRALRSGEVDAAIVAASNLYMSPEHVIDDALVGQAHSPTGLCHTFDAAADGYVKAEAVSCLVVKRLETALRDKDPIRAVLRGIAVNSNGRTNGISSPSSEAQAAAILKAYADAGITDLNDTQYLECHGTGTKAGDAIEVAGVATAFAAARDATKPLIIGSIKSNVGHAEPAAGLSGIIKAILSLEHGMIPGTPLFINPNPNIDFAAAKVHVSRTMLPWPTTGDKPKRASVNSFGYGGANAHAILEGQREAHVDGHVHHVASIQSIAHVASKWSQENQDDSVATTVNANSARPCMLVLSANDAVSLKANVAALCDHLLNPRVTVSLRDLAYTLSQRRSHLWHRAFVNISRLENGIQASHFSTAKKATRPPRIGLVFTGQGAQWSQMGRDLLSTFPMTTRAIMAELDKILQSLTTCEPPQWSLLDELTQPRTPEHLRQPEYSQPLVTALQICLLAILEQWGINFSSVVGHSSGEIAAAYAAGLLDRAGAIKAAFLRGKAVVTVSQERKTGEKFGMLAVGMSVDAIVPFLQDHSQSCSIACFNSSESLTISGPRNDLESLERDINAAGRFARLLQVDVAYHSPYMEKISDEYGSLLSREDFKSTVPDKNADHDIAMFSSVTASKITKQRPIGIPYWKSNLVSPVRFNEAIYEMLSQPDRKAPNIIIEIGPSGALAGPLSQILKSMSGTENVTYYPAWSRGADPVKTLFDMAGRLFITGAAIDLQEVNRHEGEERSVVPRCIVDLPSYRWNHTIKYWHESIASRDWRFRHFVKHDLIGSKIPGTPWTSPTWHKRLALNDVPWLRDHKMGGDVLMPGACFSAMAIEAIYQKQQALHLEASPVTRHSSTKVSINDLAYGLRNVRFDRALVLQDDEPVDTFTTLTKLARSSDDSGWHEFRISTSKDNVIVEHCTGLVRVRDAIEQGLAQNDQLRAPLHAPQSFSHWYEVQREVGMDFGPAFQNIKSLEAINGERSCRATVDLTPPPSKWNPQSHYPLHPANVDACLQTLMAANAANERSLVKEIHIPALISEVVINKMPGQGLREALVYACSKYSGRGRLNQAQGILGEATIWDSETGHFLMQVKGLSYAKLDADPKPDLHVFNSVRWRPDVTCLTEEHVKNLSTIDNSPGAVPGPESFINLVTHKKPLLRVLEVVLEGSDINASSLWLDSSDKTARRACLHYDFVCQSPEILLATQKKYSSLSHNVGYHLVRYEEQALGLDMTALSRWDLVILQRPHGVEVTKMHKIYANVEPLLNDEGFTVVVQYKHGGLVPHSFDAPTSGMSPDTSGSGDDETTNPTTVPINDQKGETAVSMPFRAGTSFSPALIMDDEMARYYLCRVRRGRNDISETPALGSTISQRAQSWTVVVAKLSSLRDQEHQSNQLSQMIKLLEIELRSKPRNGFETRAQWEVIVSSLSDTLLIPSERLDSTIIVVPDEVFTSVMARPTPAQWHRIRAIISSGCPVLWLTAGGTTAHPERAMSHGLFRVVRRELRSQEKSEYVTIDLHEDFGSSVAVPTTLVGTVAYVLHLLSKGRGHAEPEYLLRGDGLLEIPRLVPDTNVNEFRRFQRLGKGGVPKMTSLWDTEKRVQIRGDRLGTLDLAWYECKDEPLQEGFVEVDVEAVGVNFKDVATVMGVIPEDETMIGCECAGTVRRLGPGVTKVQVGDRVVVQGSGTYVNRMRSVAEAVHIIPSWMSFEEAATIPLVYSTAIQALFHLGNLQEGQSVLIHSAAGGVGMAAIQLSQYRKAEVFVTVGSDEKRDFLCEQFGLRRDHIFSSRNAIFAREILTLTYGRGVDIVLNSLTGDLLDASWRLVADGGTMVEIGKRDILDRNALAMEPFGRNCSFQALDLSHSKSFQNARLLGKLMEETFELIEYGHVGPIRPITTYGFDNVLAALACIRKGQHMGKIVISKGEKSDRVPVTPQPQSLQFRRDVCYLIVGGIKGLCGSLALHMARHGARYLVICNRSGIEDEMSSRIVSGCRLYGCEVTGEQGDVCDMDFVRRVFKSQPRRIAGVIQGAMTLRDMPFESMSLEEYQVVVDAKVLGTWNLHNAALERASSSGQILDFFTLLSSISGVLGNKGQSNYAAANAFLDSFASYRRSLGLPAHSVDLGAVKDVGYIAEQEALSLVAGSKLEGLQKPLLDRLRRDFQWTPLNEEVLCAAFTASIFQQQAQPLSTAPQLVTGIAYPLTDTKWREDPRMGFLFGGTFGADDSSFEKGDGSNAEDAAVQEFTLLRASSYTVAGTAVLEKAATTALALQTAKVLRLETEIEVGKPLAAYGLDSLSAVELRGWIRNRLGAAITTLDIVNARSLAELGEKIVLKIS